MEKRFPGDLTSAEEDDAQVMLQDASFWLSVWVAGLQDAIDANVPGVATGAMLLVVVMVKRALLAQRVQQTADPSVDSVTETWGPFNQSVKYRSPSGNLYLYDNELASLLSILRGASDNLDAVSYRSPGL